MIMTIVVTWSWSQCSRSTKSNKNHIADCKNTMFWYKYLQNYPPTKEHESIHTRAQFDNKKFKKNRFASLDICNVFTLRKWVILTKKTHKNIKISITLSKTVLPQREQQLNTCIFLWYDRCISYFNPLIGHAIWFLVMIRQTFLSYSISHL